MSTDTSSAVDQPTMTAPPPKLPRDKVMRIATMTKQLLDEVRTQTLDTAGLKRLLTIDTQIIVELLTDLTPDLREELQRLALPLTRHTELSDAELRLAHAQLAGWLQGLLQKPRLPYPIHTPSWRTTQSPSGPQKALPRRATSPPPRITSIDPTSNLAVQHSACPMTLHPTSTIQRSSQPAKH